MDTSDPNITFDESGICNHCLSFVEKSKLILKGSEGKKQFEKITKKIRHKSKKREYDCILGLSGGVDSAYVAVIAKNAGLRPLVVHVDAGWNSELSVYNIERIVDYCKFDLYTEVIDWQSMKNLQTAYLASGIANQDVPQDHIFFASLYKIAKQNGIKYILSGSNIATEGIFPSSWHGDAMDSQNLKAIFKRFGTGSMSNYTTMSFFQYYFMYPFIYRMETVKPLNYIDYNKKKATAELISKLDYRPYSGKHGESVFTKFFQSYYLPKKYGFDKRRPHLSSLIASGQLKREHAMQALEDESFDETTIEQELKFVAKKLGITPEILKDYINDDQNISYHDLPNWSFKIGLLRKIYKILKRLGLSLSLRAH